MRRMVGTLLLLNGTTLEEQDDEVVTLTVVTKEERPYVMLRAGMEGNDAYDGLAIRSEGRRGGKGWWGSVEERGGLARAKKTYSE